MSEHTPGPWAVEENTVYALNELREPCNIFTAQVHSGFDNSGRRLLASECYANAKLMAAAPDLLAALEGMVEVYAGSTPWNPASSTELELHDLARAAIARAKGESK